MLYQTKHNSTLPPAGQTVTLVVLFIRSIVITSAYGNTNIESVHRPAAFE